MATQTRLDVAGWIRRAAGRAGLVGIVAVGALDCARAGPGCLRSAFIRVDSRRTVGIAVEPRTVTLGADRVDDKRIVSIGLGGSSVHGVLDRELSRELASRNGAEPAECDDDVARVRVALRELPGERRAILSLRYLEGLSLAEIARVFGIPEGTVKSRLHHARNELRRLLENE